MAVNRLTSWGERSSVCGYARGKKAYIAQMIRDVPSRWQEVILVCGKCTKRAKGGFGKKGRTPLAKVLRGAGVGGKNRKAHRGVVETGCLKLCPGKGVVALNTAHPGRWLAVAPGTGLAEVMRRLNVGGLPVAPDPVNDDPPLGALPSREGDR